MENIIFYAPYLVCIILLFIVGSNYTKINKLDSNVQFWHESFDDVSKRLQELTTSKADLLKLFGLKEQQIEVLKYEVKEKNTTIQSLKELVITKTESINKHSLKIYELESTIKELETELDRRAQTIVHWNGVNYDQVALIQKQSDEITILKEQNESLTKFLQERAKPKTKK